MSDMFERTQNLIGKANIERLKRSRIAVFGIGGVGSAAFEALVRAGVGKIDVFDGDEVKESNLNRQLIARISTLNLKKTSAAKKLALDINPDCVVTEHSVFYTPENADEFDLSVYDYVIDAIDMVSSKIELVLRCKTAGVPIISCMGTGNKLNPSLFEVSDIYSTSVCPLCRVMRHELKKRGVKKLKVVFSKEEPRVPFSEDKRTPSSISFVPPVAGMILAAEAVKDIIGEAENG